MDVALSTSPAASAPAPPVRTSSAPGGADGPSGSSPNAPSIAKATAISDGDASRCTTDRASQIRARPQQTINATSSVSAARRRTSASTARPRVALRPAARRATTSAPTAAGGAHHSPVMPSRTAAIATSMRRIGRSATATCPGCGASCGASRRSSAIRAGIVAWASSEPTQEVQRREAEQRRGRDRRDRGEEPVAARHAQRRQHAQPRGSPPCASRTDVCLQSGLFRLADGDHAAAIV